MANTGRRSMRACSTLVSVPRAGGRLHHQQAAAQRAQQPAADREMVASGRRAGREHADQDPLAADSRHQPRIARRMDPVEAAGTQPMAVPPAASTPSCAAVSIPSSRPAAILKPRRASSAAKARAVSIPAGVACRAPHMANAAARSAAGWPRTYKAAGAAGQRASAGGKSASVQAQNLAAIIVDPEQIRVDQVLIRPIQPGSAAFRQGSAQQPGR